MVEADLAARLFGPIVGQKACDIDRDLRRIGDEIVAHEVRVLCRLGEEVQPVGLAQ